MMYYYKTIKTPVGKLKLIAQKSSLVAILWNNGDPERTSLSPLQQNETHPVLIETEQQLNDYFAGKRQTFTVKLALFGTDFQKKVWHALLNIPFGETRSYGEIAKQIGHPKAVRAVGGSNGRNPIPIIVPCHRVIGSNGTLTGFTGTGGLKTKAYLLQIES